MVVEADQFQELQLADWRSGESTESFQSEGQEAWDTKYFKANISVWVCRQEQMMSQPEGS